MIKLNDILQATAKAYGKSPDELLGKGRTTTLARARSVAYLLARELTDASFPEIGREFGGRDHCTVIRSLQGLRAKLGRAGSGKIKSEIAEVHALLVMRARVRDCDAVIETAACDERAVG